MRFCFSRFILPVLVLMSLTSTAQAFSFAEQIYTLLNQDCSKLISPPSPSSKCQLQSNLTSVNQIKDLKSTALQLGEENFLAKLADERSKALQCTKDQLSFLMKDPNEKNKFTDDLSAKLILLGTERRKMEELRPALGFDRAQDTSGAPLPGSPRAEYKEARLKAEAILASIPFTQVPAIQNLITQVVTQNEQFSSKGVDESFEKYIRSSVVNSLPQALADVDASKTVMDKGVQTSGVSLDKKARESLAQDTDLIESFHKKNRNMEAELKPIACRIDAKYGQGAEERDFAIMIASILGTGVASGVAKVGAGLLSSSITGAVVVGRVSTTAAQVLRVVATATQNVSTIAQFEKCVLGQNTGIAGTVDQGGRCETSVIKSIDDGNCMLNTFLTAAGSQIVSKVVKNFLSQSARNISKINSANSFVSSTESTLITPDRSRSAIQKSLKKILKTPSAPEKAVETAKLDAALADDLADSLEKVGPDKKTKLLKVLDRTKTVKTATDTGETTTLKNTSVAATALSPEKDPQILIQSIAKDHPIARLALRHEFSHASRLDSAENVATSLVNRKNGIFREEVAAYSDQYDFTRKVYSQKDLKELRLTYPPASQVDVDRLKKAGVMVSDGNKTTLDLDKLNHDRGLIETTARVMRGQVNDYFNNWVTTAVTKSKADFIKNYVQKEAFADQQNMMVISDHKKQAINFMKWATPAVTATGYGLYEMSKEGN